MMRSQRSMGEAWRCLALGGGLPLGLLALTACYTYSPVMGERPAPGDEVRVRLSQPEAIRISDMTGRPIRTLEGRVFHVAPDTVSLDVGWGAVYAGTPFAGRRDTLSFHQSDLLEVDRKELSRGRTALLGAGFVAAIVVVVRSVSGGGSGDGPGNGNGNGF